GPPESNGPPERDCPPERDGPPDPLDHPGGMITHWVLKKSLQVQVEANRDLLTPDLAAILQDAWDQYLLDDQIHALIKNGEYDRLARDATDITDFHHYLTTTGELPTPTPNHPSERSAQGDEASDRGPSPGMSWTPPLGSDVGPAAGVSSTGPNHSIARARRATSSSRR